MYQVIKGDKETRVVDIMIPNQMHELLCEHFGVALETIALALENEQSIESIAYHTMFAQIGSDCSVDGLIERIIACLNDIQKRVNQLNTERITTSEIK